MRALSADRRAVCDPSMLIGDLREFILYVFNANKQQDVFTFKSLRAHDVDLQRLSVETAHAVAFVLPYSSMLAYLRDRDG